MSTPTPSTPSAPGTLASAGSGAPDLAAIRQRQQATWASGDFAVIGVTLQIVGETLAEAAEIRAREEVIDIAAGTSGAVKREIEHNLELRNSDEHKQRFRAAAERVVRPDA